MLSVYPDMGSVFHRSAFTQAACHGRVQEDWRVAIREETEEGEALPG